YVPGYGKFTLFNKFIIHWDLMVSAGVGVIQTEIIPRFVKDAAFKNNQVAANVGAGTRLYISNWLTFNVAVRDYLFNDQFEPNGPSARAPWPTRRRSATGWSCARSASRSAPR